MIDNDDDAQPWRPTVGVGTALMTLLDECDHYTREVNVVAREIRRLREIERLALEWAAGGCDGGGADARALLAALAPEVPL